MKRMMSRKRKAPYTLVGANPQQAARLRSAQFSLRHAIYSFSMLCIVLSLIGYGYRVGKSYIVYQNELHKKLRYITSHLRAPAFRPPRAAPTPKTFTASVETLINQHQAAWAAIENEVDDSSVVRPCKTISYRISLFRISQFGRTS